MVEYDYEELVNATESFCESRLIGKGSHGSVYKAIIDEEDNRQVAAVKKPSYNRDDNTKKLDNEIHVLSSLQQNPYVINFLGTSHNSSVADNNNQEKKLLVMEFMSNGSLHDLLHLTTSSPPLPWPKRVEIAIQIAKAIQFLHESNPLVIHRDIKSTNILFDSNWTAKLADFGLAVSLVDSPTIPPAGTIGYLDPCYTTPNKLSTKNDVFSFGVVLLEIISCRKAIDVTKSPVSIVDWAMPFIKRHRFMELCDDRVALPTCMKGTIRHMLSVAARCVSIQEENRPEIREIVESCFVVERVKFPIWTTVLGDFVKRRQRKSVQCVTTGRILLREILADIN